MGENIEDINEDDDDDKNPDKIMEIAIGSNTDIRDNEFRFQHDPGTVRSLLSEVTSTATSRQDLMLLKLILAKCGVHR